MDGLELLHTIAGFTSFGLLAVAAIALFKYLATGPLGARLPGFTALAAYV